MALDLTDWSPSGNNLTNHSGVDFTASTPFAQSTHVADLTPASSYLSEPNDTSAWMQTGNFTVEFWIKTSVTDVYVAQCGGFDTAGKGWFFYVNAHKMQFTSSDHTGNTANVVSTTSIDDGAWHHIAGVYDGSNLKMYVAGVNEANTSYTHAAGYNSPNYGIIGARDNSGTPDFFYGGLIDEFRIWSTNRSTTDISNNKSIELSGSETNLVFYAPFESLSSASASASSSSSASLSPSASASSSASASLSPSQSASSSASASKSPSASTSSSVSSSTSASVSASLSPSGSISPSISPSSSFSPSASPSIGFEEYTRQETVFLPTTDTDLTTIYSSQEKIDVSTYDGTSVGQVGTQDYMVHQFKLFVGNITDDPTILCRGSSTLAPSLSPVYLQIYNRLLSTWQTLDSNGIVSAGIKFRLAGDILDFSPYRDSDNVISCRVYQLAI